MLLYYLFLKFVRYTTYLVLQQYVTPRFTQVQSDNIWTKSSAIDAWRGEYGFPDQRYFLTWPVRLLLLGLIEDQVYRELPQNSSALKTKIGPAIASIVDESRQNCSKTMKIGFCLYLVKMTVISKFV